MKGQTLNTPVDADWLDWVAENRLLGCTQESMVAAMTARGIAPFDAAAAIAAVQGSPCYRAADRLAQRLRKLESVLAHQHTTWALAPGSGQVARRVSVSRDEFLRDFVAASRPLVLTGLAADWPALRHWAPEQLADRFGDVIVEVQSGRSHDSEYELNKLRHRGEMPLATLVQRVLAGAGNDLYLTANNQALKRPALAPLLNDIGSLPDWVDRPSLPGAALLWLGGAGTKTPLHHDTVMLLHTQVVGRKLWHLASPLQTPCLYNTRGVFSPVNLEQPDLGRHPAAGAVQVLEVLLEPGETLFVPLGWWHQVRSLDVSVSLSFTNLDLPNRFDYHHPVEGAP